MDQQAYRQRVHSLRRRAAQDTTKHYKEETLIEEVWRTIKEALKLEISPANYQTYLRDTHAIAFDRDTGTLLVEASRPLVANQLNNYFGMTILGVLANTNASIQGVPVASVDFIPRLQATGDPPQTGAPARGAPSP
jgi:hypothetical protein